MTLSGRSSLKQPTKRIDRGFQALENRRDDKRRKEVIPLKTLPQIYQSLCAYALRQSLKPAGFVFLALEACGLLFLIAGVPFLSMEGHVLFWTALIWLFLSLIRGVKEYRAGKETLALAKEQRVNPLKACYDYLYQEAAATGRHMRDPNVYRKARIYFSERILTRTLLKTEG